MQRFTQLFLEVDRTTRMSEKTAALRRYFEDAPPEDAAWALAVLTGQKIIRRVPYKRLRAWAGEVTGFDDWLLSECHSSVGDLSETLALLLPLAEQAGVDEPLHRVIEERILPLARMTEAEQRRVVMDAWRHFDGTQRFLFHKLISGNFRFGAARKVVVNALAAAANVEAAVMQHRLSGAYKPGADAYERLLRGGGNDGDPARPYPFFLAHQLDEHPTQATLGPPQNWRAEWKWDGIRAQLIRRAGQTLLWSRGDELITDAFPELRAAGDLIPGGTVLDGEVLAWDDQAGNGVPLPFGSLQKRLNRKHVEPMLFADVPVVFMAYDLLEHEGRDQRERTTDDRRATLEAVLPADDALRLSPRIAFETWPALADLRGESRRRGVEGVMLKRADAPYGTGRTDRGKWWKWKVDPYTVDCVMVYAQRGSGRRSTLYTDYTFAVWSGTPGSSELVPVTKAYSGLTDEEFAKVDSFIRRNSTGKKGSFRQVKPELVFEIAFEGINASDRHKSGVALRFPRMHRWRTDKKPQDADTLDQLKRLLGGTA